MLQLKQMQQISPPPIYIKANYSFKLLENPQLAAHLQNNPYLEFRYLNQPISAFGVSGLRWAQFDPLDRVGEKTDVTIDVLAATRYKFTTPATLTAEITGETTYLGLKFYSSDFDRSRLMASIKTEGFYPTNYIRKYPRIPASGQIHSMPLRAILRATTPDLIVFDIANMSPNGILLLTENPLASTLLPGTRVFAQVEPRGNIHLPFEFEGLVCRVMMDKDPKSPNIARYLGIRFLRMVEGQKEIFEMVLRTVLENIQRSGLGGNGDTSLSLEVARVHDGGLSHFGLVITEDLGLFEESIYEGRFAVVDVSHDGDIANVFSFVHGMIS
jgi:hypothetical protein